MIILNWILNALALIVVSAIVPGVEVGSFFAALAAALILGLVNVLVRPVLLIISLPITILTFGLFSFVINALMLELVASIVKGFTITSFGSALLGAIVLTLINWLTDYFFKASADGKVMPPER